MLSYNFKRIFKARGIDKAFAYLKNAGFPDNLASNIKNNRVKRMNLATIEHLCILLRCTPNDLMEWVPDDQGSVDADHPLYKIKRSDKIVDISKTLNNVPLDKLESIEQLIKDELDKE